MTLTNTEPNSIETQVDVIFPDSVSPQSNVSSDGATSLIPVGFIAVWTIIIVVYFIVSKATREIVRDVSASLYPANVPCRHCRFFNNNPYLKCTVRPTTAMTGEAIDCSDFQNRQQQNNQ